MSCNHDRFGASTSIPNNRYRTARHVPEVPHQGSCDWQDVPSVNRLGGAPVRQMTFASRV